MGRFLRGGVLFAVLFAGVVTPAAADPILMFLLGIARDMIITHAQRQRDPNEQLALPVVAAVYPGTTVQPEYVRRLIDDSYSYLSDSQREEIFVALNAELMSPRNAAMRGAYIQYFAERANMMRAAQLKLSQMPYREKQRLAQEFKTELAGLPVEEQTQMGKLLRDGMLPVPSDLNQLLLAAYESR